MSQIISMDIKESSVDMESSETVSAKKLGPRTSFSLRKKKFQRAPGMATF